MIKGAPTKADLTVIVSDDNLLKLTQGSLNPQQVQFFFFFFVSSFSILLGAKDACIFCVLF